jgi:hypothetical protein
MLRRGRLLTMTVTGICLGGLALPLSTLTASAATTATSTDTLTLTAGALSVAAVSAGSTTAALGSSPASSSLAVTDWGDTTGGGAGWNSTMAVSLFNDTGTWSMTGGTDALVLSTSAAYTGSGTQAHYAVTVTSDSGGNITAAVTGTETATITAQPKSSPIAVGTHGVTIKFDTGTTYVSGDQFTLHAGNLAASALVLGAGTSITANGTTTATAPAFTNSGSTIIGGTATTVGSGVKFATAAVSTGMGSFRVTPSGTIAFDGNLDWAGAYTAQVSYSIVTGP